VEKVAGAGFEIFASLCSARLGDVLQGCFGVVRVVNGVDTESTTRVLGIFYCTPLIIFFLNVSYIQDR
jgi:hypothetical protein